MKKIKTIFKRDDRYVFNQFDVAFDFENSKATEKVGGTNVRITMRSGTCVRYEKRRNPIKAQKALGIIQPWYVDVDTCDKGNTHLIKSLDGTVLDFVPDGEWSAEAFGENIQGNPLNIVGNQLFIFSWEGHLEKAIVAGIVPEYEWLKENLKTIDSQIGNGKIEGIVWHGADGSMAKIKTKDFSMEVTKW